MATAVMSDISSAMIPPRFANQDASLAFFATRPRGLDFSDPGTGKTRVQIDLVTQREGKALVLAPKTLLETAWEHDIKRFAPHLTTSVAYAANREHAFQLPADVYITNVDATRWLARQSASFFEAFSTLVVDEISAFKHRTSLRSKCLRKIIGYFEYRYGLSGTPDSNSVLDLWHPAFVIDDGHRLGSRFFAFRNSVAFPIQVGPDARMVKWEAKPGAEGAVADLLSDITIRHRLEDCQDIPDNHMYSVDFELPPAQRTAYNEMEEHALLDISGETVTAVNAAVLIGKLLQIASGSVYAESGDKAYIQDARYDLILDLVDARRHSLVFFNWRHQRERLVELCEQRKITYCVLDGQTKNRAGIVDEFQKGYYKVCFAHPQSAAHGITLTRASATIWASPTYNLEHFIQGNRRIYRAGQKQKTETLLVTARGTIEPRVYTRLAEKNARQASFLDLVRELQQT